MRGGRRGTRTAAAIVCIVPLLCVPLLLVISPSRCLAAEEADDLHFRGRREAKPFFLDREEEVDDDDVGGGGDAADKGEDAEHTTNDAPLCASDFYYTERNGIKKLLYEW